MMSEVMTEPVLFTNLAPMIGTSVPDWSPPSARSADPAAPKLYVFPALPEPVPVIYKVSALVLVYRKVQPAGSVLTPLVVPVEARESNDCWYAVLIC